MSLKKPMGKTWGYWWKKLMMDMARQRHYQNHRCYHRWEKIADDKEMQKEHFRCSRCHRVRAEFY